MDYGIIKTEKGKWQLYQIIKPPVRLGELPNKKAKRLRRQILAEFKTEQQAQEALMATVESRPTRQRPRANRTDRGKHLT